MADRGVSEALGFVLIFALVVTTLGVVYVSGMAGLTDARDAERVNNAERAFDVLADNVEAITQRGAPSRSTEVRLADAELRVDRSEEMRVFVGDREIDAAAGAIVYDSGTGSEVSYGGGAVIRSDRGADSLSSRPPIVIDDGKAVIQLVELYGSGPTTMAGDRTVLVRTERIGVAQYSYPGVGGETVTVSVDTDHERAWVEHFESAGGSCTVSGTVECSFETDELHVTRTDVSVELS